MRRNRGFLVLVAVVAVGAVVGATAGVIAPRAFAAACSSGGTRYNSEVENSDGSGNHFGVGDLDDGPNGMWIGSDAAGCARVSSLFIMFGPEDNVEAGWYRTVSDYPAEDSCAPHTDAPHLFAAAYVSGFFHCQDGAALSTGQRDGWKLVNTNGDDSWDYVHNGTNYDTKSACCAAGQPVANGERHSSTEDAYADMPSMEYYSMTAGSWIAWGASNTYADDDPQYLPECYSAIHVGSALTSTNECS